MSTDTCTLCRSTLASFTVKDEEKTFCCMGCYTVFQILSAQDIKENFETHPFFLSAVKEGIISSPDFPSHPTPKHNPEGERHKIHLEIANMWCASCADLISLILQRQKGIYRCVVDYATDLASIEFSPFIHSKESIFEKIRKLGYSPKPLLSSERNYSLWIRFAVSLFCTLNLMCFAYPLYLMQFGITTEGYEEMMGALSCALSLPLVFFSAWPIWRRFFTALKAKFLGMETLILIGVGSAFGVSTFNFFKNNTAHLYYDSMGMVLTFILLGKIFERKAKFSAKNALFHLTRSLPKKGYKRFENGTYRFVPLKEIECGDTLLARIGEKIVLDGLVESGEALVDESIMTGESIPKRKNSHSTVVGGSIIKKGNLHYKVTAKADETLLNRIFQVIESGLKDKKHTHGLLESIIKGFIPFVFVMAALGFFYGGFLRMLSVLLISCPCAIGIAIPLAESLLLQRFAERGALVRSRSVLSILAKNPFFVFDKTGTLTEGHFKVQGGIEKLKKEETHILKAIASRSKHPISSAIFDHLGGPIAEIEACEEKLGLGLIAFLNGKKYMLGSDKLLLENSIKVEGSAETCVYFTCEDRVVARIALGDNLKKKLPKVEGAILSGDSQLVVEKVVSQTGLNWGKGNLTPFQKKEEIERLKKTNRPIVMIGDGVNDAPALTAADVGISVSSASDISIEISDILLTTEKLDVINELVDLAKRGKKVIFSNLFWAFFYNVLGIGLAVFGILTPFFSALAMTLSSLFVTFNSFYFLRARKKSEYS